jgi:XTP/dITP diphosphohydrolase
LLQGVDVLIVPLDRAGRVEVPPEGGDSFQENARLKAMAASTATGHLSLADDSGLEVDFFGGQPGVLSARFGGARLTDTERNCLLLRALEGVPVERRTARFRCAVALANPTGAVWLSEGVCEGRIAMAARGEQGFGYDPIFEIPSLGRTLAEVGAETKNCLSHRAQAIRAVRGTLEQLLLSMRC